jgi:hypothetical protein
LVRALGAHRYVASRLLLVHAFVFDAVGGEGDLLDAYAWAVATLADKTIDRDSRDERLWRRANERELGASLAILWGEGERSDLARRSLAKHLDAIGIQASPGPLFDEEAELEIFPPLVDAGWELLPLRALDPERHRGAVEAFGDPFAFDCAKFEEESQTDALPPLHELPVLGAGELLHGAEHGMLRAPLVVWTEGNDTYQEYVLRGVLKSAKLD